MKKKSFRALDTFQAPEVELQELPDEHTCLKPDEALTAISEGQKEKQSLDVELFNAFMESTDGHLKIQKVKKKTS